MIIYKINIISFAGIKNKVIEFDEKINLIYGENEKGKSSIENFIRVFLYGLNSKRTKDIKENDRLRFMPIDEDKIRGEIYISYQNRKYIIKRTFGKTKKEDKCEILDAETGEEVKEIPREEPGRYFLNVNSATFNKTLFIRQLGVSISKDKEEEIIDKAANLLDSDEENISVQKSFEKLEALKKEITTPRKTGKLDNLRDKISKLIEERYEAYNLSEEGLDNEKNLINAKDKRAEIRNEINNLNIYKRYIRKIKLQKEYEDITLYLRKKEELIKEDEEIKNSLKYKSGIIDESIIENIKNENSLYLNLKDIKKEEEEALENKKIEYEKLRLDNEDILFLEKISIEEKNSFIKNIIEEEALREKITSYENIKNDIYETKFQLDKELKEKGVTKELKDNIEKIKELLNNYEKKLIELKNYLEGISQIKEIENKKGKTLSIVSFSVFILSLLLIILLYNLRKISLNNTFLYLVIPIISIVIFIINKFKANSEEEDNRKRKILEEEISKYEEEIYKYTKIIEAKSYEEFILKVRNYENLRNYIEIENIKINEKLNNLDNINILELKSKYEIVKHEIDKMKSLAKTEDTKEIMNNISKFDNLRKDIYSLQLDIENLEKSVKNHDNEIEIREDRIKELINDLGVDGLTLENIEEKVLELKYKIKKRDEVINAIKGIDETYKALTKDKNIDDIKEDLKDIINANLNYDYSSEEEIDTKIEEKSNELIEYEKLIKDLENEINNRFLGKRKIPEIEEEIENSFEEVKELEKKLKAIELAIETMKESLREVRGNFSDILNNKVILYFNKLTNDKYKEVMVSDSYEMKVRDENEMIKAELLSNGANDQLYLALRLAFINMIYKHEKCPLFLDDAFIQYDDIRLNNALEIIKDLDFSQVFILTCQKREEDYLNKNQIKFNYITL